MNTIKRIKWHHSIEKRLVIIFVFAMTLMFGIMTSISMYAAHNEKKEQEEKLVGKYLFIGLNLLGARVDSVAEMAKDYGYWNETFDFINTLGSSALSIKAPLSSKVLFASLSLFIIFSTKLSLNKEDS